jgi:multidrug efflux pump subunit AcrA (membrane-fusion protein)
MSENNFENRSEVVKYLLNDPLSRFLKYGNSIILLTLIIVTTLLWFIEYPDVITGEVKIIPEIPSVKIVSPKSGEINKILKSDGDFVRKGQTIASFNVSDKSNESSSHVFYLTAPISGRLTHLQYVTRHHYVQEGSSLFAVIPYSKVYTAQVKVAKSGYGTIKVGQQVIISLEDYPKDEFGQLIGTVKNLSFMPENERYNVRIELVNGLNSTRGKKLNYLPEMSGVAEIITQDKRLIERVFNKF